MRDSNLNRPLFKYTTHFGANILADMQLKVTPPNEFNDPFEFSPYVAAGSVTENHIQQLMKNIPAREVYDEMLRSGEKLPPFPQFEQFVKAASPVVSKFGIPAFEKSYSEIIANQLDMISKRHGLVCFSEEENNLLLWSHYTDCHRGMLIEFNTSHSYFQLNSYFLKVKYGEKRVPFNPLWDDDSPELDEHCKAVLRTKNSAWAYENEWRSLFPLGWCCKKEVNSQTLYFMDIPPDLISRVILGYRCSKKTEDRVLEIKKLKGLQFSVLKAVIHQTEFRLEYKPI